MSWYLQGPFPLDLGSVKGSMKSVLASTERVDAGTFEGRADVRPAEGAGGAPGLYAVWRKEEPNGKNAQHGWSFAGLWLLFADNWIDKGTEGPPQSHPPYALEILEALTEAVWWKMRVPRWPLNGHVWSPLVVLEWPASLASRSTMPPPGVPATYAPARVEAAESGWMAPAVDTVAGGEDPWLAPPRAAATTVSAQDANAPEPTPNLPLSRSLVSVVRARLEYTGAEHTAACWLVLPERFGAAAVGGEAADLDAWFTLATKAGRKSPRGVAAQDADAGQASGPPLETTLGDTPHVVGRPLALFGGRVGFPLSGWLTRRLSVWPPAAARVQPGSLRSRDVGRRWRAQAVQAAAVLLGVTLGVLSLAALVDFVSQTRYDEANVVPVALPQPAVSVCSPDNERFMAELRCQVDWFASGGSPDVAVCGDDGATSARIAPTTDLQADFCGVYDRVKDRNFASEEEEEPGQPTQPAWAWHEVAASRACFNALRYPYMYQLPTDASAPTGARPNPDLLLKDQRLQIADLVTLVSDLTTTCEVYRPQVERLLEGAVLATHVGDGVPDAPAFALRKLVLDAAVEGLREQDARCFAQGAEVGASATASYDTLCVADPTGEPAGEERVAWKRLGGPAPDAETSLIDRYFSARFPNAAGPDADAAPLWRCHARLTNRTTTEDVTATRWGLGAPLVSVYDVLRGRMTGQLGLDAALLAIEENKVDAGPCWAVTARVAARYQPVHPLVSPLDPKQWPSEEQQLCGQVCAARFGLAPEQEDSWVTAGADINSCMDATPPSTGPADSTAAFDRLRLPWNYGERNTWKSPRVLDICAFNLVAQGYLPGGADGIILGGLSPQAWAGETTVGSGVAGGREGAAADAADGLSSYGRAHSVATCGYVATQCFATGLLGIVGDSRLEPFVWEREWSGWVDRMGRDAPRGTGSEKESFSPWCDLVRPYISPDGALPEGKLEYPCAKGVDDTRIAYERALVQIAAGSALVAE